MCFWNKKLLSSDVRKWKKSKKPLLATRGTRMKSKKRGGHRLFKALPTWQSRLSCHKCVLYLSLTSPQSSCGELRLSLGSDYLVAGAAREHSHVYGVDQAQYFHPLTTHINPHRIGPHFFDLTIHTPFTIRTYYSQL